MPIYHRIFQILDQPMMLLRELNGEVQIEDANEAFLRLVGYELEELTSISSSYLLERYNIDNTRQVLKSEVIIATKSNRQIPVRVDQRAIPMDNSDQSNRALIVFDDLSPYKWIEQKSERKKVLISGVVDKYLHIRNFRQNSTPAIFEPDRTLEDENLMQFVAEPEHERMLAAFAEAAAKKKEKSITLQTSKMSGIELELSITFTPIYDGFGNSNEFAFVIWDLKPVDSEIDAATKLKIWMAKRDITAGHLSALTGISIQTISKLRNGKILKPQRLTAELIASELQVDVHEIWAEIRK